jgi:hypothetical protein
VFYAAFAATGIVAVAGGVATGSVPAVIFGILWSGVCAGIIWTWFRLASRLEFAGGLLSWRTPRSRIMRSGRVAAIRWPASARSRYAGIELDDGRKLLVQPGPGLMEFITGVHEAEPGIVVDLRPGGRRGKWMTARPAGSRQQRVRAAGDHRIIRILASIVSLLVSLGVAAEIGLTLADPQEDFQTLRHDLANVHLPPGYHLITTRQAGTNCRNESCSITQTWAWAAGSRRTSSAACADAYHALTSAFPGTESNSPLAANAACDYFAILSGLLHPGQGKRMIEVIVQTGHPQASGGFLIELTDSYGS